MPSILGFGFIDPERAAGIWSGSRDKIITRGISMALMPVMESILVDRLTKFGVVGKRR